MYQLLIFDWDGTLMDSAQKIANCINASARDLSLTEPGDQRAKHIIGLGLEEAMTILFPGQSTATISQLIEAYRYHWLLGDSTEQRLFDEVVAGLNELNDTGALLAIATGKSRVGLRRVLDDLDVEHLFVTSRCADETRSKPHPLMLEEILEFTSIEPHKAIMIGDTTYDMEMAGHAKLAALGVSYGVHASEDLLASGALSVVDSFRDLVTWFQAGRVEPAFGAVRG